MTLIEEALTHTTDTKACEIGPGATDAAAKMFRETFIGVPYMRARYFGADLAQRVGLMPALLERLFGAGGVWETR